MGIKNFLLHPAMRIVHGVFWAAYGAGCLWFLISAQNDDEYFWLLVFLFAVASLFEFAIGQAKRKSEL